MTLPDYIAQTLAVVSLVTTGLATWYMRRSWRNWRRATRAAEVAERNYMLALERLSRPGDLGKNDLGSEDT